MAFKRRSDADIRASLMADIDDMGFTPYTCSDHTPIAGMMHVHAEDLDTVAANRARFGDRPVECNDCDAVYTLAKGWHHR